MLRLDMSPLKYCTSSKLAVRESWSAPSIISPSPNSNTPTVGLPYQTQAIATLTSSSYCYNLHIAIIGEGLLKHRGKHSTRGLLKTFWRVYRASKSKWSPSMRPKRTNRTKRTKRTHSYQAGPLYSSSLRLRTTLAPCLCERNTPSANTHLLGLTMIWFSISVNCESKSARKYPISTWLTPINKVRYVVYHDH